jgi:chromosome segregation ATPase
MKFNRVVWVTLTFVLPVLLSACDRNTPTTDKTRLELKETKAALANTQAALKKKEGELKDLQSQKLSLEDQLEKSTTRLKSTQQAFDKLQLRANLLIKELETTKTEMTAMTRKRDQLQQQVRMLTKTKEKNAVTPQLAPVSPADIPKVQEEIQQKPQTDSTSHNTDIPQQNAALSQKLQEAESYIGVGNWQAAERLLWEIRAIDASYPGLDTLNSRIQNLKALQNGLMQTPGP